MEASRVLKKKRDRVAAARHARALRVIGQALEDAAIENFSLESSGTEFTIHGELKERPAGVVAARMRTLWHNLKHSCAGPEHVEGKQTCARKLVDFKYGADDIERLEEEHKKRGLADKAKPDPYGLPEMLRLVGNYVDRKGLLVQVSRVGRQITIHYVAEGGETKIEEHDIASLYDLSVHMYLKRSKR